ncbi:MAG: hypothetical protein ABSC47_05800 [Terracidiphilus sp.]|jgi:hypothetical protein
MNFDKKSDAMNHRSVSRGKSQPSRRPAGNPEETGNSKIELGLRRANERPFVEDFNLEHSLAGASITQISISASAGFVESATPGYSRAYELISPNCVYIG